MNFLSDIITYVRRIVKSPSNAQLSDALIIDYINRFWLMDVDARIQLFDLKTKYQFETIPGVVDYNIPLYSVQTETTNPLQQIASFPVYQGFMGPVYANGISLGFYTQRETFYNGWTTYLQPLLNAATGDGVTTTFNLTLPFFPALPGHLNITGVIAANNSPLQDPIFATTFPLNGSGNISIPSTSFQPRVFITYVGENGNNITITDSGLFLSGNTGSDLYGLLMQPGNPPYGNLPLSSNTYSITQNTVNYVTGALNVSFPTAPPAGTPIQVQCYFYQQGIPRAILYFDNVLTLSPPPNTQYLIDMDAYLSPAAFFSTSDAIPFGYMAEYIARGAARKILSDTGDVEQFQFYEPFFREQEMLVWKRSQRQFTATRTATIYSAQQGQSNYNNQSGMGAT